jgi:uncharacterized membrane protein YeaQ/YmgE (transglycosylase-associated protein family)
MKPMSENGLAVLNYFREHLLASLIIVVIAGFAASKSVAMGANRGFFFYLFVGVVGSFVGYFALFYFGLRELLDSLTGFRYLFDFFAAYIGSFVVAALLHFVKPQ